MKRLEYPLNHEWHVAINRHHSGKIGTPDWKRWMYEAKTMADEVPRIARLFGLDRLGGLPKTHKQCSMSPTVPIPENHLKCCLGVKCAECPELLALGKIERATPEDIDLAKAWTCAAHIASEGGDMMNEGYVLTVSDRMYWDAVCESLSQDDEGANATGQARPITKDGRLLWVGPVLPHERHEFFLDGVNIGCVTLEQAMGSYSRSAPVHGQSKTDLIVSHTSAPPSNVDVTGAPRHEQE